MIPRKVLLFSGHMIDDADRRQARFPASKESAAANSIDSVLDQLGVNKEDLAICGGACGGDILFAEGCLRRNAKLGIYIPFDEPTFLTKSIDFANADWRVRFFRAKSKATLHVMPEELETLRSVEDPFERNNLWMLEAAARFGWEKINFICLWDGQRGDGPGGTGHLMAAVKSKTVRIYWLNITELGS